MFVENGPTCSSKTGPPLLVVVNLKGGPRVQEFAGRLAILGLPRSWSCSSAGSGLLCCRRVKRSQALRGRNLTRDNPVDGAPMALQMAPPIASVIGGVFRCHWTPIAMP